MKNMFALVLTMSFLNLSCLSDNHNSPPPLFLKNNDPNLESKPGELIGHWLYLGNVCLNELSELTESESNLEEPASLIYNPLHELATTLATENGDPTNEINLTLDAVVSFDAVDNFEVAIIPGSEMGIGPCLPYFHGKYDLMTEEYVGLIRPTSFNMSIYNTVDDSRNCRLPEELEGVNRQLNLQNFLSQLNLVANDEAFGHSVIGESLYLYDFKRKSSCPDQKPTVMLLEKRI